MNIMSKTAFEKHIKNMKNGEVTYINAINFEVEAIEKLRKYIQEGILKPIYEEIEKAIVEEYREKYVTGECICPQMEYIKV